MHDIKNSELKIFRCNFENRLFSKLHRNIFNKRKVPTEYINIYRRLTLLVPKAQYPDKLDEYHGCWCPGFLCRQDVCDHIGKQESLSGARPTNGISIEFEIRSKYGALWFKICSTEHNEILHTSRQLRCRDVCKILLWSVQHVLNQSTANSNFEFDRNIVRATGACSPCLTWGKDPATCVTPALRNNENINIAWVWEWFTYNVCIECFPTPCDQADSHNVSLYYSPCSWQATQ